jgi:hypothetical protein
MRVPAGRDFAQCVGRSVLLLNPKREILSLADLLAFPDHRGHGMVSDIG